MLQSAALSHSPLSWPYSLSQLRTQMSSLCSHLLNHLTSIPKCTPSPNFLTTSQYIILTEAIVLCQMLSVTLALLWSSHSAYIFSGSLFLSQLSCTCVKTCFLSLTCLAPVEDFASKYEIWGPACECKHKTQMWPKWPSQTEKQKKLIHPFKS